MTGRSCSGCVCPAFIPCLPRAARRGPHFDDRFHSGRAAATEGLARGADGFTHVRGTARGVGDDFAQSTRAVRRSTCDAPAGQASDLSGISSESISGQLTLRRAVEHRVTKSAGAASSSRSARRRSLTSASLCSPIQAGPSSCCSR